MPVNPLADDLSAIYRDVTLHDDALLPHRFPVPATAEHVSDVALIARTMDAVNPEGGRVLDVLDLGCGTGRVTYALAPHARTLTGVDLSPEMIAGFGRAFPDARTLTADSSAAVARLCEENARYDVIGAFWSLNYPLAARFERTTPDGIEFLADEETAHREASGFVDDLLTLLKPGGHLLVLFFDSESPEERLVTRLWERLAPFPGIGRAHTRALLTERLYAAEEAGHGRTTIQRLPGTATATDAAHAHAWMSDHHLGSHPKLVNDPDVLAQVHAFVAHHTLPTGTVEIPCGVHLVDFHAAGTAR
ncbi:methyltransferase domain-containing protein [Embleya sp. NPDC005575]|uniref:class I SAM-dependent DNA methyltransferase n=1 Tax=Embleya sp. NPDC005575 TaxID=3156892 RepID=UPI0033B72DB6